MINNQENKKILDITFAAVSVIIILLLAFLFYYYAMKSESVVGDNYTAALGFAQSFPQTVELKRTTIDYFQVSGDISGNAMSGTCKSASVSQPYRTDAFRCIVGNSIYDPCFATVDKNIAWCQINPEKEDYFLIKTTEPLPEIKIAEQIPANWAWFLKLEDGIYCSPFTGTRPVVEGKIAYYGCQSQSADENIVLVGDLTAGEIWTAQEVVFERTESVWKIKSSGQVNVAVVWK
jgi:hypothetical protein